MMPSQAMRQSGGAPQSSREVFPFPQWEAFALYGLPHQYVPDALIFMQGEPGTSVYLVLEGMVKLYRSAPDGREAVLALLQQGEVFGEISALEGVPRPASAAALEMTKVLEVRRDDLLTALDRDPALARALLVSLATRLRESGQTIADTRFLCVRSRIARKLLDLALHFGQQTAGRIDLRLPWQQGDLADMVGTNRESLNHVLVQMAAEGLIEIARRRITIRDFDRLAAAAGSM